MFKENCPSDHRDPTVAHETLVVNPEHLRILDVVSQKVGELAATSDIPINRGSLLWHAEQRLYAAAITPVRGLAVARLDVGTRTYEKLTFRNMFGDLSCKVATWKAPCSKRIIVGASMIRDQRSSPAYVTWGPPILAHRERADNLDAIVSNVAVPNDLKRDALEIAQSVADDRVHELLPEFEESLTHWMQQPRRRGRCFSKIASRLLLA